MAGVNGSLYVQTENLSFSAPDIGTSKRSEGISFQKILQFVPGNGALGTADVMYHGVRHLNASANEDLDLRGLLTDPFGNVVNNAEVCLILLSALAANANNVVMKPGAANGFLGPFGAAAHSIAVEPGDCAVLMSTRGWPVTAGTGDLLNIANGGAGTGIDYELLIVGRSIVG